MARVISDPAAGKSSTFKQLREHRSEAEMKAHLTVGCRDIAGGEYEVIPVQTVLALTRLRSPRSPIMGATLGG